MSVTSNGVHQLAASGFSLQVDRYERSRPGYPANLVAQLLQHLKLGEPGRKSKVIDLAAGTGKFTRRLLEHSRLDVTAVEPNAEMIAKLQNDLPGVTAIRGSATEIPAKDESLDAVFVAQGFHWFATESACREIFRVLKPGGALCCLWNREDVEVPWIRSILADLVEPLSAAAPQYFKGTWKRPFEDVQWVREAFGVTDVTSCSKFHRHSIAITKEQLWGRILSKSYIAVREPQEIADIEAEYNARLAKHNVEFAGPGGTEDVPLLLEIFIVYKQAFD